MNENPGTVDEDAHNENVVSEDILKNSHNHNVTLTGPTDTKPCVTDFLKYHRGCLTALFLYWGNEMLLTLFSYHGLEN